MRFKRYNLSTERTYIACIKRCILYHQKRQPLAMYALEVEIFLTCPATQRYVSSSTQNQALSAILFLYREVLAVDLPWLDNFERSNRPRWLHQPTRLAESA
ncbi:MAG: hypothetical protein HHJ09_14195 [Glaciimonas sp.]|nr:hypothetical protein [Glaciimonas sp.]